MTDFALDPTLAADSLPLGDLALSRLVLMNDATYPWVILVPRRPDAVELIDLAAADRATLMEEIALVSEALRAGFAPTKLNVAALGNRVRQLHVHLIARMEGDPAWPDPVWGRAPARLYAEASARDVAERLAAGLGGALQPIGLAP